MGPAQQSLLLQTINKRGKLDAVKDALDLVTEPLEQLSELDAQGHTALHKLAILGSDECIEMLIEKAGKDAPSIVNIQDPDGCTALHFCAAYPMCAYMLAAQSPSTCLLKNTRGVDPIDLAAKHGTGESLNALLLACSGSASPEALDAITQLTAKGAVPDTWAPNGQSALMLAAASNSAAVVKLLLSKGASLELADALGRTALMWAAGCNGTAAMTVLLDAGASVAQRDRRGRTLEDYAADFPEARAILNARVSAMESRAAAAQEALLAELCAEEERKEAAKASKRAKKKEKKAAKDKKKGVSAGVSASSEVSLSEDSLVVLSAAQEEEQRGDGEGQGQGQEITRENEQKEEQTYSISLPGDGPRVIEKQDNIGDNNDASLSSPASQSEDYPDRSSSEEGTATPPQSKSIGATSPRATSPEWCTVSKNTRNAVKGAVLGATTGGGHSLMSGSFPPPHMMSAIGSAGRGGGAIGTHHHKRSPSSTSVASTCSVASHDTEVSRQSGSERSVLRRSGGGTSPPPMPRLPAQSTATRKPSVLSRASSAADEMPSSRESAWQTHHLSFSSNKGTAGAAPSQATTWASIATGQHHARSGSAGASQQPAPLPTSALGMAVKEDDARRDILLSSSDSAALTATTTTITGSVAASEQQLVQEIVALRSEIKRLHLQQATSELAHQRELAAVLQDAASHETAAVSQAISDERMSCVVRFAGFLQNNDAALAAAIPNLLVGASDSTYSRSEMDINSLMNNNTGRMSSTRLEATHGLEIDGAEPQRLNAAMLSSLGFPPLTSTSSREGNGNLVVASPTAIPAKEEASNPSSLFDDVCSPLSSSPFSFEVGEFLRGEFSGNHSAFVQPASESETGTPPLSTTSSRSPFDPQSSSRQGQHSSLGNSTTTGPAIQPSWIAAWP